MATAEELVPFVQNAQILEMDKKIFELENEIQSSKHGADGYQENTGSGMYVCMYVCMYGMICMYICMYRCMYVAYSMSCYRGGGFCSSG